MTKCRLAVVVAGVLLALAAYAATQGRTARLSAAVAFAEVAPEMAAFLARPGVAYVQGYLRFGADLADDVIMFVDHELLEGMAQPRWVRGGDWMALVGVQRSGALWVGGGSDATLRGEPSRERNWRIHDLGARLQPDVWYRLQVVADFAQRRFVRVSLEGGGLARAIDLSDVPLDYPNFMPFDRAAMIYIVGAMRSRAMMQREGVPRVWFDDVEGGLVLADGRQQRLFFDSFEQQRSVPRQPALTPVIALGRYTPGQWYLERDESIFRIEPAPFALSGRHVGVAEARLSEE